MLVGLAVAAAVDGDGDDGDDDEDKDDLAVSLLPMMITVLV
jgi:hypothetical protein